MTFFRGKKWSEGGCREQGKVAGCVSESEGGEAGVTDHKRATRCFQQTSAVLDLVRHLPVQGYPIGLIFFSCWNGFSMGLSITKSFLLMFFYILLSF